MLFMFCSHSYFNSISPSVRRIGLIVIFLDLEIQFSRRLTDFLLSVD